ncbi:unnamed protein product [Polarella glacialis]|uniref:Uncharacterized protein n=1 Tax=Polarella glacialis TaxID=89957 RepID=A0A813ERW2_POLGL|nr:unnamed protein product [Polarella glacialis]CAE8636217.1 unnamed protein product [Polarella glacialis]
MVSRYTKAIFICSCTALNLLGQVQTLFKLGGRFNRRGLCVSPPSALLGCLGAFVVGSWFVRVVFSLLCCALLVVVGCPCGRCVVFRCVVLGGFSLFLFSPVSFSSLLLVFRGCCGLFSPFLFLCLLSFCPWLVFSSVVALVFVFAFVFVGSFVFWFLLLFLFLSFVCLCFCFVCPLLLSFVFCFCPLFLLFCVFVFVFGCLLLFFCFCCCSFVLVFFVLCVAFSFLVSFLFLFVFCCSSFLSSLLVTHPCRNFPCLRFFLYPFFSLVDFICVVPELQ